MIKLENISHKYNQVESNFVLHQISLVINYGEFIGLTGESGCGKSTLAGITCGHIVPSSGRVFIDGEDITGKPNRQIFLINQESDLFPWQRVATQIRFAMRDKNYDRVGKLINLVKLTGYEQYYPNQLSGGMKKRLAIARALAINPKLLILDESFSSLDSNLKSKLYKDLKEIWKRINTTILLITHDPSELQNMAQKTIKIQSGKIVKDNKLNRL